MKSCFSCRQRHLKCDDRPSCLTCERSNTVCERETTFRQVLFVDDRRKVSRKRNSSAQSKLPRKGVRWKHGVGPRLDPFIDETSAIVKSKGESKEQVPEKNDTMVDNVGNDSGASSSPKSPSPSITSQSTIHRFNYLFNNPPSIIGLPLSANINAIDLLRTEDCPDSLLANNSSDNANRSSAKFTRVANTSSPNLTDTLDFGSSPDTNQASDHTETFLSESSAYTAPVISHPREAYLLKIFTQTWGPIFDCLDADMTFTKSVLRIALSSFQPLFWTVLATSALQLSRVSGYPVAAAKHYRSQCSKSLMPVLLQEFQSDSDEDALFATYVMLRNYEHMTENLVGRDTEMIFTSSLAISANPSKMPFDRTGLGCASFWVHLRQDIHLALLLEVPINTDYPPCLNHESILLNMNLTTGGEISVRPDLLDCAWANQVAIILVDTINYCFGDEPRGLEMKIELQNRLEIWIMSAPTSFQPYYERAPCPAESRWFPEIWMSSDCHVLAWLYYHTAKVILKSHPPNPKGTYMYASTTVTAYSFETRGEILVHAKAICGLVMTNPNAQALIAFCHMVTVSATFLKEEAEQAQAIKLMRMAHAVTGHPLDAAEEKLRKAWASRKKRGSLG